MDRATHINFAVRGRRRAIAVDQGSTGTTTLELLSWGNGVGIWHGVCGKIDVGLGSVAREEMEWRVDRDLEMPPFSWFFVIELGKPQYDLYSL